MASAVVEVLKGLLSYGMDVEDVDDQVQGLLPWAVEIVSHPQYPGKGEGLSEDLRAHLRKTKVHLTYRTTLATWAAISSSRIPAKGDTGRVVGGLERPAVAEVVQLIGGPGTL